MRNQLTDRVSGVRCVVVGVLAVVVGLGAMSMFTTSMATLGVDPCVALLIGGVVGGLNGVNVVRILTKWATGFTTEELDETEDE